MKTTLSLERAATFAAAGYLFGAAIVTVIARIQDESWLSGPFMVALSAPTTIVYFLIFWSMRRWRFLSPMPAGMAMFGLICAFYPTVSGYFPVYFMRWELALPIIAIQFMTLAIIVALLAWLATVFGRNAVESK